MDVKEQHPGGFQVSGFSVTVRVVRIEQNMFWLFQGRSAGLRDELSSHSSRLHAFKPP